MIMSHFAITSLIDVMHSPNFLYLWFGATGCWTVFHDFIVPMPLSTAAESSSANTAAPFLLR